MKWKWRGTDYSSTDGEPASKTKFQLTGVRPVQPTGADVYSRAREISYPAISPFETDSSPGVPGIIL